MLIRMLLLVMVSFLAPIASSSAISIAGNSGTCWVQQYTDKSCTQPIGAPSFTAPSGALHHTVELFPSCTQPRNSLNREAKRIWSRTTRTQIECTVQYADNEWCNDTKRIVGAFSEPLNQCIQTWNIAQQNSSCSIQCNSSPRKQASEVDPSSCNTWGRYFMFLCDNSTREIEPSPISWPPQQLSFDYQLHYVCPDEWCTDECRPQSIAPLNELDRIHMMRQSKVKCTNSRKFCYGSDGGIVQVTRNKIDVFNRRQQSIDGWCSPHAPVVRISASRPLCNLGGYQACPDPGLISPLIPLPLEVHHLKTIPVIVQENYEALLCPTRAQQCGQDHALSHFEIFFPGVCQPGGGFGSPATLRPQGSSMDVCKSNYMVSLFFTDEECSQLDPANPSITYPVTATCSDQSRVAYNPFATFLGFNVRTSCDFTWRSDGRLFSGTPGDRFSRVLLYIVRVERM